MLNYFGSYTRKLRSVRNEKIKDMASKLYISDAYLSAAELNKRNIPIDWIDKIKEAYQLTDQQYQELKLSFQLTQMSNLYDKLDIPEVHKQILLSQYAALVKMSSL